MKGHLVDLTVDRDGKLRTDAAILDKAFEDARGAFIECPQGTLERGRLYFDAVHAIEKWPHEGGDHDNNHVHCSTSEGWQ